MSPHHTRFAKFEMLTVHRSSLQEAPVNPRLIDDISRARLEANLIRLGLTEPIIWNRVTSHIIAGHQRIAALDKLHGLDYHVTVSVVDIPADKELDQIVFLNNPAAQGTFDPLKLFSLAVGREIDLVLSGFDSRDDFQEIMLGMVDEDAVGALFGAELENQPVPPAKELESESPVEESAPSSPDTIPDNDILPLVVVFDHRPHLLSVLKSLNWPDLTGEITVSQLTTLLGNASARAHAAAMTTS